MVSKVIASPEKRCLDSASTFLSEAFKTDVDRNEIKKMTNTDDKFHIFKIIIIIVFIK